MSTRVRTPNVSPARVRRVRATAVGVSANRARSRWWVLAPVPFLLLASGGLTHPHTLDAETAARWTTLHVVLLPVWPLMGAVLWLVLRGVRGVVAGLAKTLAVVFGIYYGALDAIAGVAAGQLVGAAAPGNIDVLEQNLPSLFDIGNRLAFVGTVAYLAAVLLTIGALWPLHRGPAFLVGGGLSVLGAVSFLDSHIYWPRGVVTMLVLAAGMGVLAWVTTRACPRVAGAAKPARSRLDYTR